MAIINDPRLYSGGSAVLNSQPHTNLAIQMLAKQQAKRDALDQYYQKSIQDTTPTGMRNKDVVGGWSKKFNDWQNFAMNPANRKFMLNPRLDGYKTVTRFNSMHQDLLADAAKSKQELADEKMMNGLRVAGKWNPTDDDMEIAHRKGLSIYDSGRMDENGNDVDLTNLSFNIPEFTPLQEQQLYKSASQGITKSKTYNEKDIRTDNTGLQYVPFEEKHPLEQIKVIADNYSNGLTKSAKVHYERLMQNNDVYNTATKAYQQVYGDNELIDSPEKMAKAIGIIHAMGETKTGEEKAPDWMLRTKINMANSMKKIAANKVGQAGNVATGNAFDDFEDAEFGNFNVKGGVFYNKDGTPRDGEIFITGNVLPGSVRSALSAGGIDDQLLNKGVTATIKDGKLQSISSPKIGTITRGTMEGVYQRKMDTEPLKGKPLQFKEDTPQKEIKVKSTYKLGDKTITIDQVRKGAKKYNMTIEEYIKQTGLQ